MSHFRQVDIHPVNAVCRRRQSRIFSTGAHIPYTAATPWYTSTQRRRFWWKPLAGIQEDRIMYYSTVYGRLQCSWLRAKPVWTETYAGRVACCPLV